MLQLAKFYATVLGLISLGNETKDRYDPISILPPKVAKASIVTCVTVAGLIAKNVAM
jgi:hypothetical protein